MMAHILRRITDLASRSAITSHIGYKVARPEALLNTVTSRYPIGTNIYESDWDLLIILDACRVDALEIVSNEYEFIQDVESIWSVGSASREWVQKTFVEEYKENISNTVYVTANPWVERVLGEGDYLEKGYPNWDTLSIDELQHVDRVWKFREEKSLAAHPEGTSAPELVTDRAIALGREMDFERMIVHYVPPHHSYVANALGGRPLKPEEAQPFDLLRDGHERESIWQAYLDELRWALEWVSILLSNIDAPTTIISSDHGDAFGEYGVYMHNPCYLDPNVKKVPWVETTAEDENSRKPTNYDLNKFNDTTVEIEDQLRAMGYL